MHVCCACCWRVHGRSAKVRLCVYDNGTRCGSHGVGPEYACDSRVDMSVCGSREVERGEEASGRERVTQSIMQLSHGRVQLHRLGLWWLLGIGGTSTDVATGGHQQRLPFRRSEGGGRQDLRQAVEHLQRQVHDTKQW